MFSVKFFNHFNYEIVSIVKLKIGLLLKILKSFLICMNSNLYYLNEKIIKISFS